MKRGKNILKTELHRGFHSIGFKVAFFIGLAVVLAEFFVGARIWIEYKMLGDSYTGYMWGNAYGNCFSMYSTFDGLEQYYYYLVPFLATLPMGVSFYQDLSTGYVKNVLTRTERHTYLRAKYAATICTGGAAVVLPVVINFLLMALLFPLHLPFPCAKALPASTSLFIQVYYSCPILYLLFFWLVLFLVSGLFATIALIMAYMTDFLFTVAVSPFMASLIWYLIGRSLGLEQWIPFYYVQAMQVFPQLELLPILITLSILAVSTYIVFMKLGNRKQIW